MSESYWEDEVKKTNLLSFLAVLVLAVMVTACASPASSESESPPATPGAGAVEEQTGSPSGVTGADATGVASPEPTAELTQVATPAAGESSTSGKAEDRAPASATATLEPEVQRWPVLLDPEYAFSVHYPTGWFLSEEDVAEEDAPLVRAYSFAPAQWKGEQSPVTVEVVDGAESDFQARYPQLADAIEQEFGGNQGRSVQLTEGNDAGTTLYALKNPDRETWWVVIRVRATEDTGVENLGEKMANSFRWGELPAEPEQTPEASS